MENFKQLKSCTTLDDLQDITQTEDSKKELYKDTITETTTIAAHTTNSPKATYVTL